MKLRMHGDGRKGIEINAMGVAGSALSTVMIGYLTYCLTTSYAMAGTVGYEWIVTGLFWKRMVCGG